MHPRLSDKVCFDYDFIFETINQNVEGLGQGAGSIKRMSFTSYQTIFAIMRANNDASPFNNMPGLGADQRQF